MLNSRLEMNERFIGGEFILAYSFLLGEDVTQCYELYLTFK